MTQQHGESKKIGDHTYTVYMLPPSKAVPYVTKMQKLMVPIIGELAEKMQSGSEADVPIAQMAGEVADRLSEDDILALTSDLKGVSEVDGVPMSKVYDVHFRGILGKHMKWQMFAFRVNFDDFFSELKDVLSDAMGDPTAKAEASKSQST